MSANDFPLRNNKLPTNKIYKGKEIPPDNNTISKTLQLYNYNGQNIRRFKVSNIKQKTNLYENAYV